MENDQDEFLARHNALTQTANKMALEAVLAMNLPLEYEINEDSFLHLIAPIKKTATRYLARLEEKHGKNISFLFGITKKEIHYAPHSAGYYMKLMEDGGPEGVVSSPQKYAEYEGWAYTLYNSAANIKEDPEQEFFRDNTPYTKKVEDTDLLVAAGLLWLSDASTFCKNGQYQDAMKWINEGLDAFSLENGITMFQAGMKLAAESSDIEARARSAIGKMAANARHADSRENKLKVFAWCDENMQRFTSMDDAASDIAETFVPQKFRAVRDWMTEWKKLRSAGKP